MTRIPQHRRLSELLKDHILSGRYVPGDLLPSEHALCEVHSVTRPTVRQALDTLVAEGLIKKQQGKGSIVQPPRGGIGILNIVGTTDSVPSGELRTSVIDPVTAGDWPTDFPFELDEAERTSGCLHFSRLRKLDGAPVFFERTYLPNVNLPRFTHRSLDNQSLFRTLQKYYGVAVTGGEQRIWATSADADIAELLACALGDPVLQLYKRYETNRPYYGFYSMLWCNTSDYYLQGSL